MMKVWELRESELFLFSERLTIRNVRTHEYTEYDLSLAREDNVINAIPSELNDMKVLMIQPHKDSLIISLI